MCGRRSETRGFDTGIEGITVVGPQCPVEIAGSPCPDKPFAARFSLTEKASGIKTLGESDRQGRFRILLNPGDYTIASDDAGPPSIKPQNVIVKRHAFTRVTIHFDSGIR